MAAIVSLGGPTMATKFAVDGPGDQFWGDHRWRDRSQLLMKDGIVCRQYTPGPNSEKLLVPIIPKSYQQEVLHQGHDAPNAGYVGADKTATNVRQLGYWVRMMHDINRYCSTHQYSNWKTMADGGSRYLKVPTSCHNNEYILVLQDYFTKWAEAIPLPNQTATTICESFLQIWLT